MPSLAYRSPTICLDGFEWHVAVYDFGNRATTTFRFRPAGKRAAAWRPIAEWSGKRPRLWRLFQCYTKHAKVAARYITSRAT